MAVRINTIVTTTPLWITILISVLTICHSSASDDPYECSTKCSIKSDSFDCWEKTEDYFVNQLIEIANGLAGVEVMIDRWKKENDQSVNVTDALTRIMNSVHSLKMNKGPLNDSYIDTIVEATVTQVLNWAESEVDSDDYYYNYSCPIDDDYVNSLWIYMFVCESIVLILTLVFVIIYSTRLRGEMKKHKRLL